MALCRPESTASLRLEEWDLLVRQARCADLLARLCILLEDRGLLRGVPSRARKHLESARTLTEAHARAVRWEAYQIRQAVEPLNIPVILLKGAAYVLGELPPGSGRLFYDVDILVPKAELDAVEQGLLRHGWTSTHLDPYDQRYYRQWMHELPPLRHIKRHTVLDVHHTILPQTARLSADPHKLIAAARPINGGGCLKTLAPADMVLHSATHLFHEGELDHGLRDLVDLDSLLRHFGVNEGFWPELLERARDLDLIRPLYYALRYTSLILGTPVPETAQQEARVGCPGWPAPALMQAVFTRALAPDHPSCDGLFIGFARWFLYVRGHSLRMPLRLLIPHLIRKAVKRRENGTGRT
jgi:hypothetical protein